MALNEKSYCRRSFRNLQTNADELGLKPAGRSQTGCYDRGLGRHLSLIVELLRMVPSLRKWSVQETWGCLTLGLIRWVCVHSLITPRRILARALAGRITSTKCLAEPLHPHLDAHAFGRLTVGIAVHRLAKARRGNCSG